MTCLNLIGQPNAIIESVPGTSQPQRNITCVPRLDINYILCRAITDARFYIEPCFPLMSRNACNGENGEKSPAAGDLNWMTKVAPWRLAILAKMAKMAKLPILAKIAMHAVAKMAKNHQPLAI